ncbi:MAG TPA: prolyl oligopeptidase family serine peptidase [Terracidiphilus sp.]|nr:prolyl oligopeptidase family serine peptidase [Terracidiphilus sp.]
MLRFFRTLVACVFLVVPLAPAWPLAPGGGVAASKSHHEKPEAPQETGFLNRKIELHGVTYRFQVYLPEEWRRDDHKLWPIILALHGRGERGSEGMWQTQIGLPQAVRDHPERWPFVIVMPQCPLMNVWTDPEMLAMAVSALDQESAEFHGDPARTYLTGLSLGGYGAWELARMVPHRWAAIAICASGVFWSYVPERWQEVATLPAEYAHAVGRTPVWLFHGMDDPVVPPRESELMFEALKAADGHVRLWMFQGLKHDCWTRAYDEAELPRWLLAHHAAEAAGTAPATAVAETPALAERLVIPFHPPAIKLAPAVLDSLAGEYDDPKGHPVITIFRQGDEVYEKNLQGEIAELAAETSSVFFYANGSSTTRLTFEHDAQGRVSALVLHDDRHEERWEKRAAAGSR